MNPQLYTLEGSTINKIDQANKHEAIEALESGKIIYLPNYSFIPQDNEKVLLSESVLDTKRKNISYNYSKHTLAGVTKQNAFAPLIQQLTHRYAMFSQNLVHTLLPQYKDHLIWGRTSYRPAQIDGRVTSKRKDDTRIHVDAFPSTPVNGLRIFRLFCNINPYGEPRVWHVGESFSQVLNTFSKQLPRYSNTRANLLHFIKATKTKRSAYDHYMLHMHDTMKLNDHYQETLTKQRIDFPAHSTWLVFTDHVSHAALSGQFLLEQTFYLPVDAMVAPEKSPLKQWEGTGLLA